MEDLAYRISARALKKVVSLAEKDEKTVWSQIPELEVERLQCEIFLANFL